VAIISLGGIVSSTSVKHAGNKIDQAIADYIKKAFNLAIGDKTAEEVKMSIGSAVPIEDEMTYTIKGRDFMTGLPRSAEVRTNEIVRAIDGELKEIIRAIKTVFQDTPPELSSDVIDQGITLTGGSSQLKGTGIALEHLDVYKRSIIAKR
jgi:rod shape-determining protein MreB